MKKKILRSFLTDVLLQWLNAVSCNVNRHSLGVWACLKTCQIFLLLPLTVARNDPPSYAVYIGFTFSIVRLYSKLNFCRHVGNI